LITMHWGIVDRLTGGDLIVRVYPRPGVAYLQQLDCQ
jgi:hypothetical protein